MSDNGNTANTGRIIEIKGVVIDAVFPDRLPEIYTALEIEIGQDGASRTLVAEVQQHLGDDRVRAVAMDATDGLRRGDPVVDTGASITVPALLVWVAASKFGLLISVLLRQPPLP